jgi:hypothetical protein
MLGTTGFKLTITKEFSNSSGIIVNSLYFNTIQLDLYLFIDRKS